MMISLSLVSIPGINIYILSYTSDHQDIREVLSIAVLPEYQRMGIGRQLLSKIPRPFKLCVYETNILANAFYQGAGMTSKQKMPCGDRIMNVYILK